MAKDLEQEFAEIKDRLSALENDPKVVVSQDTIGSEIDNHPVIGRIKDFLARWTKTD